MLCYVRTSVAVAVLVAALWTSTSRSTSIRNNDQDSELVELLGELREQILHEKKAEYKTLHDDVPETRYREMRASGTMGGSVLRPSVRSGPGLTVDQQNALVDTINKYRLQEGGNDMYMIRWNDKLAHLAQDWSDQCLFIHGNEVFEASDIGFYDFGQNNYATSGPYSPEAAVKDWMSEKSYYTYATDSCSRVTCDRYKQLVWGGSTDVGCGLTTCPSIGDIGAGQFLVCYFGPAGVWNGELPFIKGTAPCTQCRNGRLYCNNGLCDATCTQEGSNCVCSANCKNCAQQTSDCRCQCNRGSTGVDCSNLCTDSPLCKKWPNYLCNAISWLPPLCPRKCSTCVVANPCSSG